MAEEKTEPAVAQDNHATEAVATSTSTQPEESGVSPETIRRAMRKMAEKAPERMIEMTAMMGAMGPMAHPLHQKMNEEHITKMLDLAVQHDTNEFELRKSQQSIDCNHERESRRYNLTYFILFIALVIIILLMFRNQPAVLVPILAGVGGVVTGFIGGMGYAKSSSIGKATKAAG